MSASITGQLVELWERALPASPAGRSAEILRAFRGGLAHGLAHGLAPSGAVESLSLGERDRELLRIRRALFGDRFSAVMACSACGERLQMEFSAADMEAGRAEGTSNELTYVHEGVSLTMRAPTVADLFAASAAADAEAAGQIIVRRCIQSAERSGAPLEADGFSPDLLEGAAAQLDRFESHSRFTLEMQCPSCGRTEDHVLDIGNYLWSELQTEVMRALREVTQLARGYGWREADILAMTPLRRRLYLGMLPS